MTAAGETIEFERKVRGAVVGPYPLSIKKLNEDAIVPTRGSKYAAGLDLYALEDGKIYTGHRLCISTGISMAIPEGYYGRIAPRSGLAFKFGIDVMAGVIDSDYRGEVKVILINHGNKKAGDSGVFMINKGDRIAQLIITPYSAPDIEECDELPSTERGAGGFGSTGGFTNVIADATKDVTEDTSANA